MQPQIQILNWRALEKNTLRGFFDAELPSGLVIRGCCLHEREGRRWIGWPARSYEKDGKQTWAAIVDFRSKDVERALQNAVLAAIEVKANG